MVVGGYVCPSTGTKPGLASAQEDGPWVFEYGYNRDRTAGFLSRIRSEIYFRLGRRFYNRPFLYAVLQEVRSLILRIEYLHETKAYLKPWPTQVCRCPNGTTVHLAMCACAKSRSRDMVSMQTTRPWATVVDRVVFLEGWDMGGRAHPCKEGNLCCHRRAREAGTA